MARIRTIKPELPRDKKLATVSLAARYTFVLLISQADDEGYVSGEPRELLASLYPHDSNVSEATLEGWISGELGGAGMIEMLDGKDGRLVRLTNWKSHQRIDHPSPSRLAKGSRKIREGVASGPRTLDLGPNTPRPKASWTEEAGQDWATAYDGLPAFAQIGKHLKPLVVEHQWETVRPRWQRYLGQTEGRYASPARFAQTYGTWGETAKIVGEVTADQAADLFRAAGLKPPDKMPAKFTSMEAVQKAIERHREVA